MMMTRMMMTKMMMTELLVCQPHSQFHCCIAAFFPLHYIHHDPHHLSK